MAPEYNLMSWALSSLQLSKYYKDVILYADQAAAEILIDKLKLPYSKVFCELDFLGKYDSKFWALPKIHSYSVQEEPFLHVDSDVYIWEKFENELINHQLIAQNLEIGSDNYRSIFQLLESELTYYPQEVLDERKSDSRIFAYNAGILGGQDVEFFQIYKKKAFDFVEKNAVHWEKKELADFNILFEQYLFYCLAKKFNKSVGVYFNETINEDNYRIDLTETPHNSKYTHLLGGVFKTNKQTCNQLAFRLRQCYPEYYYRIIALFKDSKTPLYRDYYSNLLMVSEDDLKKRYFDLNKEGTSEPKSKANFKIRKELIFFRKPLVLEVLEFLKTNGVGVIQDGEAHLKDLNHLEESIFQTVSSNFSRLPGDYLYFRDMQSAKSIEFVYGDKPLINDKILVAEENIKVIVTQFDWSLVDDSFSFSKKISKVLSDKPSSNNLAIIPECDLRKYSLLSVDKLDMLILDLLKKSLSIRSLLEGLKKYFHPNDLVDQSRYENLIHSRLKFGLLNKIYKAVIKYE